MLCLPPIWGSKQRCDLSVYLSPLAGDTCWQVNPLVSVAIRPPKVAETGESIREHIVSLPSG